MSVKVLVKNTVPRPCHALSDNVLPSVYRAQLLKIVVPFSLNCDLNWGT